MGAAIQRRAVLDGAAGSHTHRETPGRAPRPRHSSTSAESPVSEHGPFTQRRARAQRTAKVATFGAFDLDYPVHSRTTESYGEHAEERVTGIAGPRFARAERTRDPRNKPRGTPWRLVSGSLVRSDGAGQMPAARDARSTRDPPGRSPRSVIVSALADSPASSAKSVVSTVEGTRLRAGRTEVSLIDPSVPE
jgi:hypothetical protein